MYELINILFQIIILHVQFIFLKYVHISKCMWDEDEAKFQSKYFFY